MAKWLEADMEKVDRLMELYVEFAQRVTNFEQRTLSPEEEAEYADNPEDIELDALDAGKNENVSSVIT